MATHSKWSGERAIYNGYKHLTTFIDGSRLQVGRCLQWVRGMFGIAAVFAYAYDVWTNCPSKYRHVTSDPPPRGAVALYRSPNVSGRPGHIAIGLGGGKILSTDLPTAGKVGVVDYMDPVRRWGHSYVGWTWWLNNRSIWVRIASATLIKKLSYKAGWDKGSSVYAVEAGLHARGFLALRRVNKYWDGPPGSAYSNDGIKKWQKTLGDTQTGHPSLEQLRKLARRVPYFSVKP